MSETITKSTVYERQDCVSCGVVFFIPQFLDQMVKAHKGQTFYCPNGHSMSYREGDVERLKRELSAAKQREEDYRQQRDDAQRLKIAALAAAADLERAARLAKKRAALGVCPCCHRTVSQMARHIKSKHPDFVPKTSQAKPEPPKVKEKSPYVKGRLDAILCSSKIKGTVT